MPDTTSGPGPAFITIAVDRNGAPSTLILGLELYIERALRDCYPWLAREKSEDVCREVNWHLKRTFGGTVLVVDDDGNGSALMDRLIA